jgi:hypothetical protein
METNKILSALSYFSIFFAGIILPLIILLLVSDRQVKKDAKAALISHFLPWLLIPLLVIGAIFDMGVFATGQGTPIFIIGAIVIGVILSFAIVIWNVYRGVKVLM